MAIQEDEERDPAVIWRRYEEGIRERVAAVHPEVSTVSVVRDEVRSNAGATWDFITVTLLLTPFAGAIMTRLGDGVSDLASLAAKKVVGRFLRERQEAIDASLQAPNGEPPRQFVLQVLVPDTGVLFVLPRPDEQPEERAAAALAMLEVDVAPLASLGSERCEVRWNRGAWSVAITNSDSGWDFAHWSQEAHTWLLSNGEVWQGHSG